MEKKPETQIRHWISKLMNKHLAESVVVNAVSHDTIHITVFRNGAIVKDYDYSSKGTFTQAKKCTFNYWDKYDSHVTTFDSLSQAAKFFNMPRQTLTYYIKRGTEFLAQKPFSCSVQFLYWGD